MPSTGKWPEQVLVSDPLGACAALRQSSPSTRTAVSMNLPSENTELCGIRTLFPHLLGEAKLNVQEESDQQPPDAKLSSENLRSTRAVGIVEGTHLSVHTY